MEIFNILNSILTIAAAIIGGLSGYWIARSRMFQKCNCNNPGTYNFKVCSKCDKRKE